MKLLQEKDTQEIALKIYELSKDMDFSDYEEEKEKEISEIEQCLYHLKTIAKNEHNQDYFRTFYNALQKL